MRSLCLAAALAISACSPSSIVGAVIDGVTYAETGKSLTAHAIDFMDERTCLVEYMRNKTPREGCDHEVVKPIDDPAMERPKTVTSLR